MSAGGVRDLSAAEGPRCACGHNWLEHHGADPEDGCMGLALWRCPCRLTAGEVAAARWAA